MKIILSGVETNNKGAELMLYAILQEIERVYPDSDVYLPYFAVNQGLSYIKTSLRLHFCPYGKIKSKFRIVIGLLRRLRLVSTSFYETFKVNNANYFIDASGFCFSDQLPMTDLSIMLWEKTLKYQHEQGTKIVFLPQSYGPAEKEKTKKILKYIDNYSDIIMVREETSWNYLKESKVIDMNKAVQFPDFTIFVHGTILSKYKHLKGGVCIIPNSRMLEKNIIDFEQYTEALSLIIETVINKGKVPFLLCHEDKSDTILVKKIKKKLGNKIEAIIGLNALEVKGIISQSYLCISSRYHGVVSSLNSTVPCLSTSWSHKYFDLFKAYGLEDCILDLSNISNCLDKIEDFLTSSKNNLIKEKIKKTLPNLESQIENMWNKVWNL